MTEALASWEALDKELLSMVDIFSSMVKASRIPDEESDQLRVREGGRRERAPGDLLEVWAEKLVHAGHEALVYVGRLKSQAMFSDFDVLMHRVRKVRLALSNEETQVATQLSTIRQEVTTMLTQLEDSYYGSPYRGRPQEQDVSGELKELAAIVMELAEKSPADTAQGTAAATQQQQNKQR